MRRHNAAFQEAAKLHIIPLSEVTCRMIFPKAKYAPLLTADDCKFLADIAVSWDLRNNGMTRAEIVTNSDGIEAMCLKTASHKPIWLPCTQSQAIWIDHFLSDRIKWWCCSGKIKPSAIVIYSGAFLILMWILPMCWIWFPRRLGSMCQVLTCLSSSCLCCLRNTNYFNKVWCMLDVGLQFSTPAARVNIARMRECVFQSHAAKQECAIRQGCLAKAAWQRLLGNKGFFCTHVLQYIGSNILYWLV